MADEAEGSATVAEIALAVVECPRCGAKAGESCAAAMKRKVRFEGGNPESERELDAIDQAAPHLAHPERFEKANALVDSAEAYGLVRRVAKAGRK